MSRVNQTAHFFAGEARESSGNTTQSLDSVNAGTSAFYSAVHLLQRPAVQMPGLLLTDDFKSSADLLSHVFFSSVFELKANFMVRTETVF